MFIVNVKGICDSLVIICTTGRIHKKSTMYILNHYKLCTLYISHHTLSILFIQHTIYTIHITPHTVYTVHTKPQTVYTVHIPTNTIYTTYHTTQSKLYISYKYIPKQSTPYITLHIVFTAHIYLPYSIPHITHHTLSTPYILNHTYYCITLYIQCYKQSMINIIINSQ